MNKGSSFEANIPRPFPDTNENEEIIKYIEPLRNAGLVLAPAAYLFNLGQYTKGEECSLSPGFKYTFWFKEEQDMVKFMEKFGVK